MKTLKYFICTSLALCLLITPSLAHRHSYDLVPIVSPWAQEELEKAWEIGFGIDMEDTPDFPFYIPNDYTESITRRDFCALAMQYMAIQYNSTSIVGVSAVTLARQEGAPLKDMFSDGNDTENVAYHLGVVEGRGDGIFDPHGLISRQEAAVMLTRAYRALGGSMPKETQELSFVDQEEIADWARESVAALDAWKVMQGKPDGSFDPQGAYTVEQSVLTFLRLYENAEISRKNGNIAPRFSYEDSLYSRTHTEGFVPSQVIEGKMATFIASGSSGAPRSFLFWTLVDRDGSIRIIDWGICMCGQGYPDVKNARFSEDGTRLFATITLDTDYPYQQDRTVQHKKGIYHIMIDVATGASELQWEEWKEEAGP